MLKNNNIYIHITAITVAEKMQSMLSGLLFLAAVVVVESSRVFFLVFFFANFILCFRPKHSHDACVRAVVYTLCSIMSLVLLYTVYELLYLSKLCVCLCVCVCV